VKRGRILTLILVALLVSPASAQTSESSSRVLAGMLPDLVERVEDSIVQVFVTRFGPSTDDAALGQIDS